MAEEGVAPLGEKPLRLEGDELRHAVHDVIRDDGKVLQQPRIVADVDADRPHRRVVAKAEAGRDRTSAAREIRDRGEILESLQRTIADDRGVDEYGAIETMHQWNAQLDTSLDDCRTAGRSGDEPTVRQRVMVWIARGDRRVARAPLERSGVRIKSAQRGIGDRQHARTKLIFAVTAYRHRAAGVKARPRMKHGVAVGTRDRAHDAEPEMAREHLMPQSRMPVRGSVDQSAIVAVVRCGITRRVLQVHLRDVTLRWREWLVAAIDER